MYIYFNVDADEKDEKVKRFIAKKVQCQKSAESWRACGANVRSVS